MISESTMMKRFALLGALLAATAAGAQAPATNGQVTKIDKANARVTIKHGEIKHLDMPPMTMVFRVRDPKLLEGLAVGDPVRFTAERVDGNFTVTSIGKAP
jgi:Cu/Ag efflux protein CusF